MSYEIIMGLLNNLFIFFLFLILTYRISFHMYIYSLTIPRLIIRINWVVRSLNIFNIFEPSTFLTTLGTNCDFYETNFFLEF